MSHVVTAFSSSLLFQEFCNFSFNTSCVALSMIGTEGVRREELVSCGVMRKLSKQTLRNAAAAAAITMATGTAAKCQPVSFIVG